MGALNWRTVFLVCGLMFVSLDMAACGDDDDDASGAESSALQVYPETPPGDVEQQPVPVEAAGGGATAGSRDSTRRGGCGMTRDGGCPMCDGD